MAYVQRVNLRFKAKFISDNARQLTDEIGTAVGNRLRQRLKFSVPAILGTWLVAVVGIVEMLQNCLTIICVRFAIIWGNCLCSLLAWWWALSWVWWGHFISMARTSAKYINKNWMDEWINEYIYTYLSAYRFDDWNYASGFASINRSLAFFNRCRMVLEWVTKKAISFLVSKVNQMMNKEMYQRSI